MDGKDARKTSQPTPRKSPVSLPITKISQRPVSVLSYIGNITFHIKKQLTRTVQLADCPAHFDMKSEYFNPVIIVDICSFGHNSVALIVLLTWIKSLLFHGLAETNDSEKSPHGCFS